MNMVKIFFLEQDQQKYAINHNMQNYIPAIVMQFGSYTFSKEKLGHFNLSVIGHSRIIPIIKMLLDIRVMKQ